MVDLSTQPDIQRFGKQLKRLRERSGHSQRSLSAASGVTVKQISKLENGRAEPKYLTLIAFADAMNLEFNDFRWEGDDGEWEEREG